MQNMIADAPIVPITEPNILPQIVEHLQASSAYQERKSDIENFNAGNRWKKRGLSLVPMLYGQSSWQGKFYFQLSIFATDATIAISCGAIGIKFLLINSLITIFNITYYRNGTRNQYQSCPNCGQRIERSNGDHQHETFKYLHFSPKFPILGILDHGLYVLICHSCLSKTQRKNESCGRYNAKSNLERISQRMQQAKCRFECSTYGICQQ